MTKKTNNLTESEVIARLAAQGLANKKGEDIRLLDLRNIPSAPASFFVICSGNVPSHVEALADSVHEVIKQATGQNPSKVEGYQVAEWVLMDYFDVLVHIFQKEKRDFFRLEDLWADGVELRIEN